jgi:transposase-like protein
MDLGILTRCPSFCPFHDCKSVSPSSFLEGPNPRKRHIVRKGRFFRKDDSKWIARFKCLRCKRSFSNARFSDCYRQKKRRINPEIDFLFSSWVSQRRISRRLKIDLKTVARKLVFLGSVAKRERLEYLKTLSQDGSQIEECQFDELETFEKTKCLPLSVPLVIGSGKKHKQRILSFRVASMPAKGMLAEISRKKYGRRKDERRREVKALFEELGSVLSPDVKITTDQNPKYPGWIQAQFPKARHVTTKGRRGCSTGFGELKRIGFDPLFSLNHSCAMLRANINRLARKTWYTTKRADRLEAHLEIYVRYHNRMLQEA